jgi:hypothetical protein
MQSKFGLFSGQQTVPEVKQDVLKAWLESAPIKLQTRNLSKIKIIRI